MPSLEAKSTCGDIIGAIFDTHERAWMIAAQAKLPTLVLEDEEGRSRCVQSPETSLKPGLFVGFQNDYKDNFSKINVWGELVNLAIISKVDLIKGSGV